MKLTMEKRKGKENQNCDRGKEYLQALFNFFNFLIERSSTLTNNSHQADRSQTLAMENIK